MRRRENHRLGPRSCAAANIRTESSSRRNACCTACNVSLSAKPSMVTTSLPAAAESGVTHDLAAFPPIRMVQAPTVLHHSPAWCRSTADSRAGRSVLDDYKAVKGDERGGVEAEYLGHGWSNLNFGPDTTCPKCQSDSNDPAICRAFIKITGAST